MFQQQESFSLVSFFQSVQECEKVCVTPPTDDGYEFPVLVFLDVWSVDSILVPFSNATPFQEDIEELASRINQSL